MQDYNSNDVELEELLKLLKETETLSHNDPFISFLNSQGISTGSHPVPVKTLINLYGKQINFNKAVKLISDTFGIEYIKAIPHAKIDTPVIVKKKAYTKTTVSKYVRFLQQTDIKSGDKPVPVNFFYLYYDTWCYINKKRNPLSKREFLVLGGRFFTRGPKGFKINRELDITKEVASWREQNAKKKQAIKGKVPRSKKRIES